MKKLILFARIAGIIFNGYLYFGMGLDFFSCLISVLIVFAITTPEKKNKPEADTSGL
jgi:hypothetical protein